jgi:hypothetical protein
MNALILCGLRVLCERMRVVFYGVIVGFNDRIYVDLWGLQTPLGGANLFARVLNCWCNGD